MIEKVMVNILTVLIEMLVVLNFSERLKKDSNKNYCFLVVFSVLSIAFSVFATVFSISPNILMIGGVVLQFGLTFTYKLGTSKRFVVIFTYFIISMAYEILVILLIGAINNITAEVIQSDISLYFLCGISSKSALYITIKMLIAVIKPSDKSASRKYDLLNLLFPVVSVAILMILSHVVFASSSKIEKILILVVSSLLVAANVVTFVIYDFGVKNVSKVKEQQIDILLLEKQKKEYNSLIETQLRSNKEMHDLKHKMFSIREYIAAGNPKAIEIVDVLCQDFKKKQMISYTELADLDALLNAKMNVAENKGINLKYHIFVDDEIFIDSMDLCVLLGNLLDNAIEGSEKYEGKIKSINVSMKTNMGCLAIKCDNPSSSSSVTIGKSVKEKNPLFHGFGLKKIEELTKLYDGSLDFIIKEGTFYASLLLKNRKLCIDCVKA